jgi:putative ABC transport system permease protein
MSLWSVAHLHRVWISSRPVLGHELLTATGLAVGVALLFASQIASASLNGSAQEATGALVGNMQFQLDARDHQGFDQRLLTEVQGLPGVRAAIPIVEEPAVLIGPRGRRSVELIGTEPAMMSQGSPFFHNLPYKLIAGVRVLALPSLIAQQLGARRLRPLNLQIDGSTTASLVGTVLGSNTIGGLADDPVAVAPLAYAQQLTGIPGRITRIFIRAVPGHRSQARAGLVRLAGSSLNVEPASFDSKLFNVAAAPANQSQGLFSGISALVGFLFAFNAMLLTLPLRQRLIKTLRFNGATKRDIATTLLFHALTLGGLAAFLGLVLGNLLSLLVFRSNPGYLALAFPIGARRIVTLQSIVISASIGILAASAGVLPSFWERFSRPSEPGKHHAGHRREIGILIAGSSCIALTVLILLAAPQSAVLGCVLLLIALLLLLPQLLDAVVSAFDRIQAHLGSASTRVALVELLSPRTRARSLAIAATGATAVFGSVAIQGAHANLQRGLDRSTHEVAATADLWVVPPETRDLLATTPFHPGAYSMLAGLPGVRAVGLYRGGFLDYGDRRVWVLAPPETALHPLPASQIVKGNLALATTRLRVGGWAVLSQAVAEQHHLQIGKSFTLPSPHPMKYRLAALSTNLGWAPGAIILNTNDYAQAWGNSEVSAYNLMLMPGVSQRVVSGEVQRALGPASGLAVESAQQRERRMRVTSRQGLSWLTQIATLVLIAAILAMSIAMGAMISQRRPRLARLQAQGYQHGVLWRALICESSLLLGAGCSIGAAFGVAGQLLISHALASVTGFPIAFSTRAAAAALSTALVSAGAIGLVTLLGYRAAKAHPYPDTP